MLSVADGAPVCIYNYKHTEAAGVRTAKNSSYVKKRLGHILLQSAAIEAILYLY